MTRRTLVERSDSSTPPFPEGAQILLNTLYRVHPTHPATDRAKIHLLRKLTGASYRGASATKLRRTYESIWLDRQGVLCE